MIKRFLNSAIAKYGDLSVSRRPIDLPATDKSQYFVQPCPIFLTCNGNNGDAGGIANYITSSTSVQSNILPLYMNKV